jgi:aarF domain-containing kinase
MRLLVLVRPNPENPKIPQVVLIDHGCKKLYRLYRNYALTQISLVYVTLSDKFKKEYSTLWRSLFVGDLEAIEVSTRGSLLLDETP